MALKSAKSRHGANGRRNGCMYARLETHLSATHYAIWLHSCFLLDNSGKNHAYFFCLGSAGSSSSAPQDTNAIVQNFLKSLNSGGGGGGGRQQQADKPFTSLTDLLTPSTTTSYIANASQQQIDLLCSFLPPELFQLAQEGSSTTSSAEATPAAGQAAIEALSIHQKREILGKVLHSPQLQQSLGSLTIALRDGGLPMIGEALGLQVENGGLIRHGSMPLGGGEAVEAFVKGVKKSAEEELKREQK